MEFSLGEETTMLKDSAARFLQEKCPPSFVKEMTEDETGYSPAMWREMADLGWLGLIHAERFGGVGASFFDLCILCEEMGKVLLPSPFFCSAVFSGLLLDEAGEEGFKAAHLPRIISGEAIYTVALLDEQGQYDPRDLRMAAREIDDESYTLDGTRILVPYAHVADGIIVCAKATGATAGGPTLFLVDAGAAGIETIPLKTLAGEKRFTVRLEGVELESRHVIGIPGKGISYLHRVLQKAVACKCAEMVGGLDRVVQMTVDYVKERHQFGRPLGTLQVVQHYCAELATFLESARLIAYQAASLIAEEVPCEKEVSIAKAWCSEAYKQSTWIAHQLHGGIGFTEEHDLHLYYKHAKASELAFGDAWFHRNVVADRMGL